MSNLGFDRFLTTVQVGVGGSSIERFVPPIAREAALGPPLTPEGSRANNTYNTMVCSVLHDALRLYLCSPVVFQSLDSSVFAHVCVIMSCACVCDDFLLSFCDENITLAAGIQVRSILHHPVSCL